MLTQQTPKTKKSRKPSKIACQAPKPRKPAPKKLQLTQNQLLATKKINPAKMEFSFTQFGRIKSR
jgi:hypothetical protein